MYKSCVTFVEYNEKVTNEPNIVMLYFCNEIP